MSERRPTTKRGSGPQRPETPQSTAAPEASVEEAAVEEAVVEEASVEEAVAERPAVAPAPAERAAQLVSKPAPRRTLRAVLLGLALLVPPAAAAAVYSYLMGAHRSFEERLVAADGSVDYVTAMAWAPGTSGPLFVGTRSGAPLRIERDGTVAGGPRVGEAPALGEVVDIRTQGGETPQPVMIVHDRRLPGLGPVPQFAVGSIAILSGLAAVTDDNGGTLITARAPAAPAQQQQQQQQAPVQSPVSTGLGLTQWRYSPGGESVEVGEIFGIEDVRALAAIPGTSAVIAGTGSGGVFAFDAAQQVSGVNPDQYIKRIGGHEAAIVAIAVAAAPGAAIPFVTAAADGTIKAWRGPVNRASRLIPLGDYQTFDVLAAGRKWTIETRFTGGPWERIQAMSGEGGRLIVSAADGRLALLDAEGGPVRPIPAPLAAPAALSRDGRFYAAADDAAGRVNIVAVEGGATRSLQLAAPVAMLAFDPAAGRLAVRSGASALEMIDLRVEPPVRSPVLDGTAASAFSPDGEILAVGMEDGRIQLRRASDGGPLAELPRNGSGRPVVALGFGRNGKRLAAYTFGDASVPVYSLRSLAQVGSATFTSDEPPSRLVRVLTPDGSRLLVRNATEPLRILRIEGDAVIGEIDASEAGDAVQWLTNADGSRIAMLGGAGTVTLFREEADDAAPGPMPALAEGGLRLSADGGTALLRGPDGRLHVASLDASSGGGRAVLRPVAPELRATQAELAADGSSLIAATPQGSIEVRDLPAATGGFAISGHGAMVQAMVISPDGAYLASASLDGRLRVTDLSRARRVDRLPLAGLPSGPPPVRMAMKTLSGTWQAPPAQAGADAPSADRQLVVAIQRALSAAGYGPLTPDGLVGAATRAAIQRFEDDNGMTPGGEISQDMLDRLTKAAATPSGGSSKGPTAN